MSSSSIETVEPRAWSLWPLISGPLGIVVGAFVVVGVLLVPFGINPLEAYGTMLTGALGSANAVAETLIYATPILLTAIAAIVCFRAGMWNIGADGQLYLGAIAALGLGFNTLGLPSIVLLPAMACAAFVAGGFWGAIPGYLRTRFGANEVIVTIMMNFLAMTLATYLISGPWASGTTPVTKPIAAEGYLPVLISGTRLHANLILALVAAVLIHLLLKHTVFGYEIRAIGQNPRAARVAGMPVKKIAFLAFALSGAIAGLAGFGEIAGIHHNMPDQMSPGFGYTGIAVALLANLNPLWAIVSALFLAILNVGANAMQRAIGVPVALVWVIQGFILLALLARGAMKRR
jgi:simple sugar transport system permease protein